MRSQNWCVIATDDNANDFAPGYRVTSTDAPSNENQFCCRASGNYNVTTQKCVVKSCVNSPAFEYSSFIHIQEFAGQHTHSCYALYVLPTANAGVFLECVWGKWGATRSDMVASLSLGGRWI